MNTLLLLLHITLMVIVCFSCPLVFQEYLLLYSNSCSNRKYHGNGILLLGVLYAPELQDDFYLNFVDWSSNNALSVGLGNCIYRWNATARCVQPMLSDFYFETLRGILNKFLTPHGQQALRFGGGPHCQGRELGAAWHPPICRD
ncbi:hypothetical protein VPH35_067188 [Triticum aestivum]